MNTQNAVALCRIDNIAERDDGLDRKAAAVTAIGHAGEILQGVVESDGRLHRMLVSLPAPALQAKAAFRRSSRPGLEVFPRWRQKSLLAAELACREFGDLHLGGLIEIQSDIPVGCGLGSSTSDCVAAIRAVAKSCGGLATAESIARITQQAEGSSDGTMFEDCLVAFLHCEGRVHQYFDGRLPAFRMLIAEPAERNVRVNTDSLRRPDYSSNEIDCFHRLLAQLNAAVKTGDASAIGAVASVSSAINQRYLPKPHYDVVMRTAEQTGALGVAAAHSGTVLVLLYNDNLAADERVFEARRLLREYQLTVQLDLRSPEYGMQ